jgi:hypothetical protein
MEQIARDKPKAYRILMVAILSAFVRPPRKSSPR